MKLYSWNVNGIRSVLRKGTFKPFMDSADPDILCLQEVKAGSGDASVGLPEYWQCWNPAEKSWYSGTAIFTKLKPLSASAGLSASVRERYDMTGDRYGDPNIEGRVITAEYEEFYLVTVYTPNSKPDLTRVPLRKNHWDPAFLEHCKVLEQTKPVVFCGDLNVAHTDLDLHDPKAFVGRKGFTNEERAGFQAFLDAGFVDTFRMFTQGNGHYTWWKEEGVERVRNEGWRIDYFLVSDSLRDRVVSAEIHADVTGSDHCPVSLTLDF